MDEIKRNRRLNQLYCEYGHIFKDERSLHAYWAHQAYIAAIRHDVSAPRTGFDISAVRSTAGWIATLAGDMVTIKVLLLDCSMVLIQSLSLTGRLLSRCPFALAGS
jgi:hypothetical protein